MTRGTGPPRHSLWQWLRARLQGRADSEHEQILICVGFAAGILGSLLTVALSGGAPRMIGVCLLIALGYLIGSVTLFGHLLWRPAISPVRRSAGMLLDLITLPLGMIVGGALVAPLYPMFLWITLGMGFRYGRGYLLAAAGLSLAGFAVVVALSEYWRAQPALAASLWIALLVLPAYASTLHTKLIAGRAGGANTSPSWPARRDTHEKFDKLQEFPADSRPPRSAEFLLYIFLSKKDRVALGDLEEDYRTEVLPKFGSRRAKLWYWSQVMRSIAPMLPSLLFRSSIGATVLGALGWVWRHLGF